MRITLLFLLIAALALPAPAAAQPPRADGERMAAELRSYGQWLARMNEIERPIQAEVGNLSEEWDAAEREGAGGNARFRAYVARVLVTIDRVNARLAAIDTPEFPALGLSEDVRPRTIVRDMIRINRELRAVLEGFLPLIEALNRGDMAAIGTALNRLVGSLRVVMESQVLLARASIAATDPSQPAWDILRIQLLFFQAASRALAAWPDELLMASRDTALGTDLVALAAQLDQVEREGSAKLEAAIESGREALAEAEQAGEAGNAEVLRRSIAVLTVERRWFPLARRLAAMLRASAAEIGDRPATVDSIGRLFSQMRQLRADMDAIMTDENAVLAAPG